MTPATFLQHWGIAENPFRGEEARHDPVFARLVTGAPRTSDSPAPWPPRGGPSAAPGSSAAASPDDPPTAARTAGQPGPLFDAPLSRAAEHAEFEKVVGDFLRPASAVVFGEKGSGKTAMRLQIAHHAAVHNARFADARVLLIAADDLTPVLERLHGRLKRTTRKGESTPSDSFRQIRLVDHVDALLLRIVPAVVDQVLGGADAASPVPPDPPTLHGPRSAALAQLPSAEHLDLGPEPKRVLRRADPQVRRDLLALATAYDRPEHGTGRTRALRWALGIRRPIVERIQTTLAYVGWLPPLAIAAFLAWTAKPVAQPPVVLPSVTSPAPAVVAASMAERAGEPAVPEAAPAPAAPAGPPPAGASVTATATGSGAPATAEPAPANEPGGAGTALGTAAGGAGVGTTERRSEPAAPSGTARSLQSLLEGLRSWPEWFGLSGAGDTRTVAWVTAFVGTLLVWILFLAKLAWTDRFRLGRQSARLYRQIRVSGRAEQSFFQAVRALPADMRSSTWLPLNDSEDQRLRGFERIRRVLRLFGYAGIVVVFDRIDEPPLVAGDPDRMKFIVWPMLTAKFLQQEGVGIKLLLPIELRHMLFRESAAFFQQARMDKQNLVEQLGWSGSTLFDLCNARLKACRLPDGPHAESLADLFDQDVGREGLVAALETMRQPRDAFKLMYHCIAEHCSQASSEQGKWRISKATLEAVTKLQTERLRQLALGIRPA